MSVDICPGGSEEAIALVVQFDEDISDAWFAVGLETVLVEVEPNDVADFGEVLRAGEVAAHDERIDVGYFVRETGSVRFADGHVVAGDIFVRDRVRVDAKDDGYQETIG